MSFSNTEYHVFLYIATSLLFYHCSHFRTGITSTQRWNRLAQVRSAREKQEQNLNQDIRTPLLIYLVPRPRSSAMAGLAAPKSSGMFFPIFGNSDLVDKEPEVQV